MDDIQTFRIWAPDESVWSVWAKPVAFACKNPPVSAGYATPSLGDVYVDGSTAWIVDQPGVAGVLEGLAFARMGVRPVPVYNGCPGPPNVFEEVSGTREIAGALVSGAAALAQMSIRPDAPPAFLMDSGRFGRGGTGKTPGVFDNRWYVFAQDLPSANFLREHGIRRVIVRSDAFAGDLVPILANWQKAGTEILLHKRGMQALPYTVRDHPAARALRHRISVMSGLTRSTVGGFGAMILSDSSGGGRHYYG